MNQTFLDKVMAGSADLEDMDSVVERWHTSPEVIGLREALGMTEDEYELWMFQPSALELIIAARRARKTLAEMAGAGDGPSDAEAQGVGGDREAIVHWLQRTGRVA